MKNLIFLFVFGLIVLLGTSCASLSGFETGKTVGKENGELALSINSAQTPDFNVDNFVDTFVNQPQPWIPNFEFGGKFGVAENVDIGIRINTNANLLVEGKFQLVGDRESDFALAVGAGFGTFGLLVYNFQLPVYASYHPKDNIDIYLSPRYIGQFGTAGTTDLINYFGANGGILFGRKIKFGIDFGYYGLSAYEVNTELLQIGAGVKFHFGGGNSK